MQKVLQGIKSKGRCRRVKSVIETDHYRLSQRQKMNFITNFKGSKKLWLCLLIVLD